MAVSPHEKSVGSGLEWHRLLAELQELVPQNTAIDSSALFDAGFAREVSFAWLEAFPRLAERLAAFASAIIEFDAGHPAADFGSALRRELAPHLSSGLDTPAEQRSRRRRRQVAARTQRRRTRTGLVVSSYDRLHPIVAGKQPESVVLPEGEALMIPREYEDVAFPNSGPFETRK